MSTVVNGSTIKESPKGKEFVMRKAKYVPKSTFDDSDLMNGESNMEKVKYVPKVVFDNSNLMKGESNMEKAKYVPKVVFDDSNNGKEKNMKNSLFIKKESLDSFLNYPDFLEISVVDDYKRANLLTHAGVFHADEVLSTCILAHALKDYSVKIFRAFKVPEDTHAIVYDIGGGEFDHHMPGGNGVRENGVPFSSAGLVWKRFHSEVTSMVTDDMDAIAYIYKYVDEHLIQGVDAVDNGKMTKADYPCQSMTISQVISGFNPTWNSEQTSNDAFIEAVYFMDKVLKDTIQSGYAEYLAKTIVDLAILVSQDGIMVLDKFVPWKEWIFASDDKKAKDIYFVVFPSNRGGYNWQCVPDAPESFGQRKSVPKSWRGLKDEALQKETGIKSAIFCHPAGFVGGCETKEDAIAMAKLAMNS